MASIVISTCLSWAQAVPGAYAGNGDPAAMLLDRARKVRDQKGFDYTLLWLNIGISRFPSDPRFYYERGRVFNEQGKFKEALQDFNKALSINKDYAECYSGRGWAYDQLNDFHRAILDYEHYLQLNPKSVRILCCLADNLCEEGATSRAVKVLDRAIELEPGSPQAHRLRGILRNGKDGNVRLAIEDFSMAIKETTYSHYDEVLGLRASAYRDIKDFPHAIADYSLLIKRCPQDANLLRQRALTYERMGDYRRAVNDYTAAIELEQVESAPSYESRARCYEKLGDKNAARQDRERARKLSESDSLNPLSRRSQR